jgi:hypothetical protein
MITRQTLKTKLDQQKIQRLEGSNKSNYPSTLEMAKNLGQSISRNIRSVAAGNKFKITDVEAKKRLDICQTCEFFDSLHTRCKKCGCFMALKTHLKAERCPIGKW